VNHCAAVRTFPACLQFKIQPSGRLMILSNLELLLKVLGNDVPVKKVNDALAVLGVGRGMRDDDDGRPQVVELA